MTPWNTLLTSLPSHFDYAQCRPHLLQTWEWGQLKAQYGWQPFHLVWDDKTSEVLKTSEVSLKNVQAAALVLVRAIPVGGFAARLSVVYVPKGPVLDWNNIPLRDRVLRDLRTFARRKGGIFLKIDPDVRLGTGIPNTPDEIPDPLGQSLVSHLQTQGWHFSQDQIQFRNTVTLDLTRPEDELLARMKQKTRYNVRLAERKGVTLRAGTETDLDTLYRMYAETSVRDGFVIRDPQYYLDLWRGFLQAGMLEPLIAEVESEPVAAVMIFRFAGTAYYLNGMSRDAHREKMPNYLLQWEAARRAKAAGCTMYDLWGAPNVFDESDSMWGVFRFKEGLGGEVVRHIGAWDLPVQPLMYKLYTQLLPRLLDILRGRGKDRTRRQVEAG
ncbi:MAG: peptidoglycan bridge formation glycyltransferase FemA/FemB family protein [Anaerolineales bacterium]|nr:peptidoglycan bridge formation glycyltransferase FemA/FemB family protein [Anaerolineales bacterium]